MIPLLAKLSLALMAFQIALAASPQFDNLELNTTTTREAEIPAILFKIAQCESNNKQFVGSSTSPESVIRGSITPTDIGKYQISEIYWGKKAKELGFDLFSESGNTQMALWIYKKNGVKPWSSSKPCWK